MFPDRVIVAERGHPSQDSKGDRLGCGFIPGTPLKGCLHIKRAWESSQVLRINISYPFLPRKDTCLIILISIKFQECYCSDRDSCNEDEDVMKQASSLGNALSGTVAVVSAATAVIVVIKPVNFQVTF